MATHSTVLAWRIPGMGEPGGLPSMGSHRVGHDRSDLAAAAALSAIRVVSSVSEVIDISSGKKILRRGGKNTRVGCHFLLQCMKTKSESEVAQSCSTLSNPTDCSLPGSSTHGIFQARRVLEWGAIAFSDGRKQRRTKELLDENERRV